MLSRCYHFLKMGSEYLRKSAATSIRNFLTLCSSLPAWQYRLVQTYMSNSDRKDRLSVSPRHKTGIPNEQNEITAEYGLFL
mmetsp:Transcript_26245/g.26155  ORF Transcript_26245/g.26155 Transcript_26245/m.26155 type:complete len:81 (-) Transcript_26245:339-581(-)